FFFSSRRRHTRSDRDWSSDVCSSDLERTRAGGAAADRRGLLQSRDCGPARDRGEHGEMVCQRDLRQTPGREPDEGHCARKGTEHRVALPWWIHLLQRFATHLLSSSAGKPTPFPTL